MPENSRIAGIADSFAALLENKSYREAKLPYEAMKELLTLGIYKYDPVYLKAFLGSLAIYPIGSLVKLSDKSVAIVIDTVKEKPMRPVLLIIRDAEGSIIQDPIFLHLLYKADKYISSAISPKISGINIDDELESRLSKF